MTRVTKEKLVNIALVVALVGILGAAGTYYFLQCGSSPCPSVGEFMRGFGAWAPVVFALLYIVSAPIPFVAPVLSAAGGTLFGALWGTLLTMVVATSSALIPFGLARRLGQDWVEAKLKGKNLEEIYQQSGGNKGFVFILLMRLVPVLPWEIQNYVAGLSQVPVGTFVLATLAGIIPGTFSLVFLGASVTDLTSWQFYAALGLKVVTALVPVIAIWLRSRKKKEQQSAGSV